MYDLGHGVYDCLSNQLMVSETFVDLHTSERNSLVLLSFVEKNFKNRRWAFG